MTTNQIAYAQHLENQRSNMANEAERQRNNRAIEQEAYRSNRAREQISRESNAINQLHYSTSDRETARHNRATEELEGNRIAIQGRNVDLGYAQLSEQQRSNRANEAINAINANTRKGELSVKQGELTYHALQTESNIATANEQQKTYKFNRRKDTVNTAINALGSVLNIGASVGRVITGGRR